MVESGAARRESSPVSPASSTRRHAGWHGRDMVRESTSPPAGTDCRNDGMGCRRSTTNEAQLSAPGHRHAATRSSERAIGRLPGERAVSAGRRCGSPSRGSRSSSPIQVSRGSDIALVLPSDAAVVARYLDRPTHKPNMNETVGFHPRRPCDGRQPALAQSMP